MSVVVVGLEQRLAPLDLFERVALGDDALPKVLARLRDRGNLAEAVVVSTCQRVEVYAVVDRFHQGVAEIHETLADLVGVPAERLEEHAVLRFDDDVADHLFSVAAGLESAVLGETEVLGQVRRAWERSQRSDASGPVLGALFRHAVEAGKRVRSETSIARG
nr:glutamyl-tRNA reductase [Actinomycetota bacterium]